MRMKKKMMMMMMLWWCLSVDVRATLAERPHLHFSDVLLNLVMLNSLG
jgi:hypothetical protein